MKSTSPALLLLLIQASFAMLVVDCSGVLAREYFERTTDVEEFLSRARFGRFVRVILFRQFLVT